MNAPTSPGNINGISLHALRTTIAVIGDTPDLANFKFRVRNQWLKGGHSRSFIQNFFGAGQEDTTRHQAFAIDNDEPQILLGRDQAPHPVEHLLQALSGCLTAAMVYHAAARGITLHAVESEVEGDLDIRGFLGLDASVRKGFLNIRVHFQVKSDASIEALKELCLFSPVLDTLSTPVSVEISKKA
jgi:uncharacterized OsmC-like protein